MGSSINISMVDKWLIISTSADRKETFVCFFHLVSKTVLMRNNTRYNNFILLWFNWWGKISYFICLKQPQEVFCKKDVFENCSKLTRKYLRQSLFFKKEPIPAALLKNPQEFFCDFWKIFKNIFFSVHLWMAASV